MKDVGFVNLAGDGVQVMKSLQVHNVGDAVIRLTTFGSLSCSPYAAGVPPEQMHHRGPPDSAGYMDERLGDNPRNENHHPDCAQPDTGDILNA